MLKFLIGPLLAVTGYAAGSYYGSDVEQVVHKSPDATFKAIDDQLWGVRKSGTTSFDGGTPASYEVKIERTPNEKLVITVLFDGREAAESTIDFVPEDNGRATLIKARINANRSVLRKVLAGTDKERLGYAPDWALNLSFKPLLTKIAGEIENGATGSLSSLGSGGDQQGEGGPNAANEQTSEESRQQAATEPLIDPDADAQNAVGSQPN